MAEFSARFYTVNKCGYYPYAADSEPELGGFQFVLEELLAWSAGKNLEDTRLPITTNVMPIYLMSIAKRAGCWVIVLWNEVPSSEGAVASVSRKSKVGNPTIHENPIAAGSIPGFPTYFVCFQEEQLLATLRYGDRVTGLAGFKSYISVFQEIATSLAVADVSEDDPNEYEIHGYLGDDEEILNLHARFQIQLLRSGTQRALILANADRIRKVVRVKEMDPTSARDLQLYQRGLIFAGLAERPPAEKVRFRQEIDVRPTRAEVRAAIDEVIEEVEPRVNDIGFVFQGEGAPLWLSGSIPGKVIELDAQPEDGVFGAEEIVNGLSRRKAAILAVID